YAGARAIDDGLIGVVLGEGLGIEILPGILASLEEGHDLAAGHSAFQPAGVVNRRSWLECHSVLLACHRIIYFFTAAVQSHNCDWSRPECHASRRTVNRQGNASEG